MTGDDHLRITTFTGRSVNPFDLQPEDVDIRDIAHALARICRFGGHTVGFLSVAEHSLHVAYRCASAGYALEGLLHDASEAYLGDVPAPIKHNPAMYAYRRAEAQAQEAIATRFDLEVNRFATPQGDHGHGFWPDAVADADRAELEVDLHVIRYRHPEDTPASYTFYESAFLSLFHRLYDNQEPHRA